MVEESDPPFSSPPPSKNLAETLSDELGPLRRDTISDMLKGMPSHSLPCGNFAVHYLGGVCARFWPQSHCSSFVESHAQSFLELHIIVN